MRLFPDVVQNVVDCDDPFGVGYTFHLLRPGSAEHNKRIAAKIKGDPQQRKIVEEMHKETIRKQREQAALKAEAAKRLKNVTPAQVEVLPAELGVKESANGHDEETQQEAAQRLFDDMVLDGKISIVDSMGLDPGVENAILLISSVSKNGKPFQISEQELREDLSAGGSVPDGVYAGMTYGEALVKHLTEFAEAHAITRKKELETAEKN